MQSPNLHADRHGSIELLVDLADLEAEENLEEAGAIRRSREVLVLENLLCELAVVFRRCVVQMALDVNELLKLVEVAVHLEQRDLGPHECVRSVEELNAWVRARELPATWHPRDRRALVVQVGRVEELHALLLDHPHPENLLLLVVGNQLSGQDLEDNVGVLLLGLNVRLEVWPPGFDALENVLELVAALCHISLDLPGKLHLVGNVEVDGEIQEIADTLVEHGVKALNDNDVVGVDQLWRV
mmetsp:Transcript_13714/g.23546  ORF Transcript_13714/g.23546 Transcript_13714/m.23546 type:complete len:242 (+) Transcript_13714:448-1173(+)